MSKAENAKILLRGLVNPSDWTDPEPSYDLRYELEKYFKSRVFPINSGRSAIYTILKAANIGEGDEVIIQAYTCNSVPNPILWTGATPIYADIEADTLNVDTKNLEEKISNNTKAVILQHTFGRPGPVEETLEIAKKHNLILIEDCAHSFGAEYKGKKLGTFGNAAILSFGREKVISSLSGGAIIVNDKNLEESVEKLVSSLSYPSFTTFLKEFNNYLAWRILIRKVFFSDFGNNLLNFLNNKDLFNVVTSKKELIGEKPDWYPKLFPGTLAKIASLELQNLELVNKKRDDIAKYYEENLKNKDFKILSPHKGIHLRFVVLAEDPLPIYAEAKKHKFWFGNWYNTAVYPERVDLGKMHYIIGSCPIAEKVASETINLPNFQGTTKEEAGRVVKFINEY